ncbi:hypothetical protein GSI_07559 [Ganoderma sinense ZZ0214-1]|uniref:Uncharacterized protein n=1 Tax=Ganoderma sinense ZZ0214-1 TaxID=1077348 RepID=A0A2G8S9C9_9APHY|nr:hypothetical protein GSI_07559 [Ganoderma sinense ZZ0214-1]
MATTSAARRHACTNDLGPVVCEQCQLAQDRSVGRWTCSSRSTVSSRMERTASWSPGVTWSMDSCLRTLSDYILQSFGFLDGISLPAVKDFDTKHIPGQETVTQGVVLCGRENDVDADTNKPFAHPASPYLPASPDGADIAMVNATFAELGALSGISLQEHDWIVSVLNLGGATSLAEQS